MHTGPGAHDPVEEQLVLVRAGPYWNCQIYSDIFNNIWMFMFSTILVCYISSFVFNYFNVMMFYFYVCVLYNTAFEQQNT